MKQVSIQMIEFAKWDTRRELAALWQVCFHESARYPKYFLNNYFLPENCLVYRVGKQIAAAVYLLPAQMAGKKKFQAHYIFAAGTFPQFRSRRYMSLLLAYAETVGVKRGDNYSVVLPSSPGLYPFYEKSGYTAFFKVRQLSASFERIQKKADLRHPGKTIVDSRSLNSFRNACLSGQNGSVLWSDEMFHFAVGMSAIYGDRLVCCKVGGHIAYAMCRMTDKKHCSILEIMADNRTAGTLAAAILQTAPAESYLIRLPVCSGLFHGEGEVSDFGMIKPIGDSELKQLKPGNPYLGLGLD